MTEQKRRALAYAAWTARERARRGPCAPTPAAPWCASAWERCGDGLPPAGIGYAYGRATTEECWPQPWHRVPMRCERAPQVAYGTWWAL